jgi:hypothetical protein
MPPNQSYSSQASPIVKQEGIGQHPVVTQPAADNPFRPQQNSFLGMLLFRFASIFFVFLRFSSSSSFFFPIHSMV